MSSVAIEDEHRMRPTGKRDWGRDDKLVLFVETDSAYNSDQGIYREQRLNLPLATGYLS